MLSLRSCQPIGQGAFRRCFIHPDDEYLCIKVSHGRRIGAPGYKDPNLREFAEYERLRTIGAPVHRFGPKIHGFVETDLGPGLCVERLRGSGGGLVSNIRTVWQNRTKESRSVDDILEGVRELQAFCIEFRVLAACAAPENIGVAQRGGREQVVAFDFKGHSNKELIPLSNHIAYFCRRKIERRFDRMIADLVRARQ